MRRFINKWTILGLLVVLVGLAAYSVQDWHQLWTISSAPDNIPIVAMLFLVPFFTWMGVRQAVRNDQLIEELEADPKLAKTHHRKVEPWRPGWARELHVWPYLVRIEFLATVIVTVVLFRPAGNAGLLRSVDRWRRDAFDHHGRLDGLSVRRFESTQKRLLHATT